MAWCSQQVPVNTEWWRGLALGVTQIATLGQLTNLSGPQFSYLCDGNNNSTDLTVVGIKRDAEAKVFLTEPSTG